MGETAAASDPSDLESNTDTRFAIHDVTWSPRFKLEAWLIIAVERRLSEIISEKGVSDNRKF
jgi:hypothetical protein